MSKRRSKKSSPFKKRKFVIYVLIAVLGAFFLYGLSLFTDKYLFANHVRHDAVITLPEGDVFVQVADSKGERERGLSGKRSMAKHEGMLFVFEYPGKYGFWMKDMNFPIDIVWISEEGRVVNIEDSISPDTYPKGFVNAASAKYVLELNAGKAREYGLYLGTEVKLDDKVR